MKKGAIGIFAVIAVFLAIIIGLTLLPTIADLSIGINTTTSNVSGTSYTLVSLVPLFFTIGIIVITLVGLKVSGKL